MLADQKALLEATKWCRCPTSSGKGGVIPALRARRGIAKESSKFGKNPHRRERDLFIIHTESTTMKTIWDEL